MMDYIEYGLIVTRMMCKTARWGGSRRKPSCACGQTCEHRQSHQTPTKQEECRAMEISLRALRARGGLRVSDE